MSELERLHEARLARESKSPQRERKDPTEWCPRPNPDYERAAANVAAESMRSQILNFASLVGREDDIAALEAQARFDLIKMMDRAGLYPDERGVRVRWGLMVEGHGFRMPDGFVHPEAPDDVKREGREAWKRCVQMASDSLQKFIYAKAWRRKYAPPTAIESARIIALPSLTDED